MTTQEKRELADMVRRGLTVEQIIKRTTATKATVKRYIKALRPAEKCETCAAPKTLKPSRVSSGELVMPRRGDAIADEYGTLKCMCVCDGYVMCRRKRAMPAIMSVKEWLNQGRRHNAAEMSHRQKKD
jgi:hypothetical protein